MNKFHLVYNICDDKYIIVRTPDYKCTDWFELNEMKYEINIYHYGTKENKGRDINDVVKPDSNKRKLICSFIEIEDFKNFKNFYPEYFL